MELNPELSYSFGLYGKGYHFDIYTYAKQFSCAQLLFQTGHNPLSLSLKLPRDPLKVVQLIRRSAQRVRGTPLKWEHRMCTNTTSIITTILVDWVLKTTTNKPSYYSCYNYLYK